MEAFLETVVIFLVSMAMVAVFSLVLAFPEMWLWNALMPDIFGVKQITWLQAAGLSLLCGWLFKSAPATSKSE